MAEDQVCQEPARPDRGHRASRTQFAEKAEVPFPWLQRATTQGITRLDRRGREHLDMIARWFGLPDAERLWDRDFVPPPPWGTREARATRFAEDLRRLVLERGEDAEPVRTVLRLIREAQAAQAEGPSAPRSPPPPDIEAVGDRRGRLAVEAVEGADAVVEQEVLVVEVARHVHRAVLVAEEAVERQEVVAPLAPEPAEELREVDHARVVLAVLVEVRRVEVEQVAGGRRDLPVVPHGEADRHLSRSRRHQSARTASTVSGSIPGLAPWKPELNSPSRLKRTRPLRQVRSRKKKR